MKEFIEVVHDTGGDEEDDVNQKYLSFSFDDYSVGLNIYGYGHYMKGVSIHIYSKNDAIEISAQEINGKLRLSIDQDGGTNLETQKRSHMEWVKLEQLEKAVKLLSSVIKTT